ncbi:MAG: hypothetical protein ACI4MS_06480 [Candidatus Coproplasma sp.]
MKKNGKILSSICIATFMAFSFTACNSSSSTGKPSGDSGGGQKFDKTTIYDIYDEDRPEHDFDYESTYVRPDPPLAETRFDPEEDPAYANGKATYVTRMEAENAEINLVNNSTTTWKNVYSDVNNMAFDFRLSGKMATRNLNTAGSTLTFNFKSDKSYTVKMNLCVSVWDDTHVPFVISDYFAVRSKGIIDGANVYSYADTTGMSIAWEDTTEMVSGGQAVSKYFHFATIELNVAVYKGDTSIVIEYAGKGGANIDYLELNTSAKISGFDSTHYTDGDVAKPDEGSEWYVSTYPTDDADGVISVRKYIDGEYRTYSYGLPKYKTEGKLTEGYTAKTLSDGKTEYSFTFKNGTYSFVDDPNRTVNITLDESSVTFANGTKTLQKKPGDKINSSDFATVADGRTIVQINVVDKAGIVISSGAPGSITVPMEDATIKLVFGVRSGFTALDAGGEQGTRKPSNNCTEVLPADFEAMGAYGSAVIAGGADGYSELGSVLICNKAMTTSARFRLNTKVNDVLGKQVTLGKNHQFAYNFENKGTVDIHLKMYQVNAGTNITDDIYVEIDLKPGESMSVVLTANFATGNTNNNALSYFAVTQDMEAGMSLGISMSVKLAQ